MRTSVRVFTLPKSGNTAAEYEDAHWPRRAGESSGAVRMAVADGATETSFSGLWARLLTSDYGRGRLAESSWDEAIRRIRSVWRRAVGQKPLPWYAEEKLRLGAFSSLTGLALFPAADSECGGRFEALAIGDSCLFHVRHGRLLWSHPFTAAEQFNSRPLLISSLDRGADQEVALLHASGTWQPGDLFFLMTDALAAWTLRCLESGADPFSQLQSLDSPAAFEAFAASQRAAADSEGSQLLKNDDLTLLELALE